MNEHLMPGNETLGLESLHESRLPALLRDTVKELRQEIGDEIGTVSKKQSLEFERLSTRLSGWRCHQRRGPHPF